MTRDEITKLLETLVSAYPSTKIKDAKVMTDTWEMVLGDFSAESVYKAARLHMDTSKFFPTPAEIKDSIVRAQLVYKEPELIGIEAHTNEAEEKYLDAFCKWIGFGYEPDDSVILPNGFMPFEI